MCPPSSTNLSYHAPPPGQHHQQNSGLYRVLNTRCQPTPHDLIDPLERSKSFHKPTREKLPSEEDWKGISLLPSSRKNKKRGETQPPRHHRFEIVDLHACTPLDIYIVPLCNDNLTLPRAHSDSRALLYLYIPSSGCCVRHPLLLSTTLSCPYLRVQGPPFLHERLQLSLGIVSRQEGPLGHLLRVFVQPFEDVLRLERTIAAARETKNVQDRLQSTTQPHRSTAIICYIGYV